MKNKLISIIMSATILSISLISAIPNVNALVISNQPYEVLSMRSQYEKHFDNGDGTKIAFVDTVPMHYKNENGEWIEIDNTLIKNAEGNYTNASNLMDVTLATNASVENVNKITENKLISIDYEGYSLSWKFINMMDDDLEFPPYCPIELSESIPQRTIEIDNKYLEKIISDSMVSKTSSVWYKSLFEGCDINFEIKPSSIKENIVLNNKEAAEHKLTYYIETNGLIAKLCDDNSIEFTDQEDNIVFFVPAPYMFEADCKSVQSSDIDVSIKKYESGYLMSYTPSKEWIMSGERNFPVVIDPDIYIYNDIYTSTLSELYPTSYITGDTLKMGGFPGDKYKALISVSPISSLFSSDKISITNARLCMFFNQCSDPDYQRGLRVSALLSSYSPWWSGVDTNSLSELERFDMTRLGVNKVDVTKLVNTWYNYVRSNSKSGVYPYGVVVDSYWGYCGVYEADSSSGTNPPYYLVTYNTDTNYTLTYLPSKYNDCYDIHNFQNRMNCYAYALQIYHQTNSQNFEVHKLIPGEIGMSLNLNANTSSQLKQSYHNKNNFTDLLNFTQEQMINDSTVMGTNLQRIILTNEEQFVLPSGYNGNTQRIIAMCAGKGENSNNFDFHFYLRHGNGTCNTHGGNCSTWSHKQGNNMISDKINTTTICDRNIAVLSKQLRSRSSPSEELMVYNSPVRFYTIRQDTNIYNSWYEYNSSSDTVSYVN